MSAFDLLMQGRIIESILYLYTNTMGAEIFWGVLLSTAFGLIYLKTRSAMLVGITMMVTGTVILPFMPPNIQLYMLIVIILGLTTMLFKLYKG